MKIPHFRGVFMRDALPHKGPWKRESAIINLDHTRGPATHWVAYRKDGQLVELQTFNAIPNIDEGRNKLYIEGEEPIVFPTGSYEIEDIHHYAEKKVKGLVIKPSNNTLRSELKCSKPIDFRPSDSIGPLLGFTPRLPPPNRLHESDLLVAILKINALRVKCNITGGAYINERRAHTIYNFFPSVPPGYKILEVPPNPINLPVTVTSITIHSSHDRESGKRL